jgi:hypothetical protein
MCVEIERLLGLGDALMARIYSRRNWYLHPSDAYTSLETYTYATRAALVADVRAYQAEVAAAAAEAAHRKRRFFTKAGSCLCVLAAIVAAHYIML